MALLLGTLWGVVIAIVIGLPALRVRGLYLAIITLGFALVVERLRDPRARRFNNVFAGASAPCSAPPPDIGPWNIATDKRAYYYVCLAVLVVVSSSSWRMSVAPASAGR